MYRGKKTYFYNGEKLWEGEGSWLIYNEEERHSWEVIIILPGVEVIPEFTFRWCENVKVVIMSDTVKRIEYGAFFCCYSLEFVKLSRNLEDIGDMAFDLCRSLTSIFIPPSCREIGENAFEDCTNLIILSVPQHTQLNLVDTITAGTRLSQFEHVVQLNEWIKNINNGNDFDLHRECASYDPSEEVILGILKERGLLSFKEENKIGITAARYLEENPFSEIDEQKLIKKFVLDVMGEVIM